MDAIDLLMQVLSQLDQTIPDWTLYLLVAVILAAGLRQLVELAEKLSFLFKPFLPLFQDQSTRDFIHMRSSFVEYLMYEVQRLNRESDWSNIYYTDL